MGDPFWFWGKVDWIRREYRPIAGGVVKSL
jgi:hypothetical protein